MREKKVIKSGLRQRRVFSEQIRKQVVRDVESGKCSAYQASRELGVHPSCVYVWLNKYSSTLKTSHTMVIEDKSEAYRSKELEKKIAELEAALGRKTLEVDVLNKLIEIAGKSYGVDLKKNFDPKPTSGTNTKEAS